MGPFIIREAATLFAVGFDITGAHTTAYSLAADCYPTALRTTGVGWGVGIRRIGSILGPVVGGMLLSYNWGMRRVFWATAIPAAIAAMAAGRAGPPECAGGIVVGRQLEHTIGVKP